MGYRAQYRELEIEPQYTTIVIYSLSCNGTIVISNSVIRSYYFPLQFLSEIRMQNPTTIERGNSGAERSSWQRASVKEAEEIYEVGVADGRHIGRREQQDGMQAMMQDKLQENMKRSAQFALHILTVLANYGFSANAVRMGTDGIFDFDLLFIVDMENYLSPEFLKVYEEISKIEEELSDATFNPHAQFLAVQDGEEWNEEALIGDGYAYTLEKHRTA